MRACILALALSAAAVPAYAQTQGQGTGQGAAQAQGTQRVDAETQQFVNKAAVGDMYEIQSSKMALNKARSAEVKQFAQRIIDDHTKSSQELKSIAKKQQGLQVPAKLDAKHNDMIKKLQSASQGQFAQLYRNQQIQAHKEAVQLYEDYAQDGDNAQLRQFAEKTLPKLKQHQQMAQSLPQETGQVGQSQQQGKATQQAARTNKGQQQVLSAPGSDHILASDLRGTNVYGANGEDVGEIDDVVLNRDGEVVAVIVGVGGFLGIGEKNVAIPFEAIQISERELQGTTRAPAQRAQGPAQDRADRNANQPVQSGQQAQSGTVNPNRIVLHGMTKQQLEAAPSFNADGR